MSGGVEEPQIVIAASDALFIQRALRSLIDGGSLLPLDREIARRALAVLERGEILTVPIVEKRGKNEHTI